MSDEMAANGSGGSKHIGIIACTPGGGASSYRRLTELVGGVRAPEERPVLTLHSPPTSTYMEAIERGAWEEVASMLSSSASALARAGADFCVLPDNTAHHALPMAEMDAPLPILNMVEIVAERVSAMGCRTVGLIGTRFVIGGSTYQTALGLRGVRLLVPGEAEAARLDDIIFREAAYGRASLESRNRVERSIETLVAKGCEAVILGYSESSTMFEVDSLGPQLIDPVKMLAEVAMSTATEAIEAA